MEGFGASEIERGVAEMHVTMAFGDRAIRRPAVDAHGELHHRKAAVAGLQRLFGILRRRITSRRFRDIATGRGGSRKRAGGGGEGRNRHHTGDGEREDAMLRGKDREHDFLFLSLSEPA